MAATETNNLLSGVTTFLLELLYFGIDWLYNAMIDIINALILVISTFIIGMVSLFPANPCGSLIASCSDSVAVLETPDAALWLAALQALAWLLPMEFLATLISCAMLTVMSYFLIAPLLRWGKLIT